MSAIWKTVRVFISSTFRDMHAERDHLVQVVFPKLRHELLSATNPPRGRGPALGRHLGTGCALGLSRSRG